MRRVAVDAFHFVGLRGGSGGSGSYVLSLIEQLARLIDVHVVASPTNKQLFTQAAERTKRLVVRVEGDDHADAIRAVAAEADILYAPFTALPERETYRHIPAVTAIHDLQHRHLKSFFPESERIERDTAYFEALCDADAVLTFSQAERKNIEEHYNVRENIGVVPHAPFLVEEIERSFGDAPIDPQRNPYPKRFGRYVLYSAVNWPHKNHYRLIEAFRFLAEDPQLREVRLVLTGASCVEEREHFYRPLLEQPWAQGRVVDLGFVSNLQLFMLLKGAEVLAFPSMYEGFGIPVLEALRVGTPVIASDLEVFREWFGGCFEPFRSIRDSRVMAEDLRRILVDPEKRSAFATTGLARSSEFSSKRTAEETLQFLSETADAFGRPKKRRGRPHRELVSLRQKTCRVLLQVLVDVPDPEIIERAIGAARSICRDSQGDMRFLLVAPYGPGDDGSSPLTADPEGKRAAKGRAAAFAAGVEHLQTRRGRALFDGLAAGLGEIVYFDDTEHTVSRSRAIQFYAAAQIDSAFHCFIEASTLASSAEAQLAIRGYRHAVLREGDDFDGFYLGVTPWASLRTRLLEVVHTEPRGLDAAIAENPALAIHNFLLTNDFVLGLSSGRRSSSDWLGTAILAELGINARIVEPRPRFAYIETELKRRVGHHFALVRGLCEAAASAGLAPVVGGNRTAALIAGAGLEIDGCFSSYSEAPDPRVTPTHFADELLSFLHRHQLGHDDYVYLHMPYPTLVCGVLQLAATCRVEQLPTFLIRICSADQSFRWHDIQQTKLLQAIGKLGKARQNLIRIFVESVPLQRYFERATGQLVPVLLNPIGRLLAASAPIAAERREQHRQQGTVTFGYFGEAREEKGFLLLPEIVEALVTKYGAQRVRFAIQVSAAPVNDTEEVQTARDRLRSLSVTYQKQGTIQLYNEFPDMRSYYSALAGCEAVLLPYDVEAYQVRGSGVALESLALGIPIVVPAGTDMATTFSGQGCIVAADNSSEELATACAVVVDKLPAILAEVQAYSAGSPLFQSEGDYVRSLIAGPLPLPEAVPDERPVAIWIGNDVLSQGCSAVYAAQRDFLERHGFEIYNIYVPFPDLNGHRHSNEALEKYLLSNSLGWRPNGFDFGCYSWNLNQSDDDARQEILDGIAKEGGSTRSFLQMNAYNECPPSLLRLVKSRQVALVCVNYVHLLPVVEKLGLLGRAGTRVVLETHDIQADQHAIRAERAVDELDKELELQTLSEADAVVAISRAEYDEICEQNPWITMEFVLPTVLTRGDLLADWRPGASRLGAHWLDVWCERADLQNLIDLRTPGSLNSFLVWTLLYGRREYPALEIGPELAAIAGAPHPEFANGGKGGQVSVIVGWIWGATPVLRDRYSHAKDPDHGDSQALLAWVKSEGVQKHDLQPDGSLVSLGSDRRGLPSVSPTLLEAFAMARPAQLFVADFRHRLLDWLAEFGRIDVIVVGSDHPANVTSIRRFIHEVYAPHLAPHGVNMLLVGRSGMALQASDMVRGLFAVGEVDALDPLYRIASVVAVPTSVGTGTPIKVLDALTRGLCLSASNFVDRSLDLSSSGFPLSADAREFAADIRGLLASEPARRTRIDLARKFAADHLSREAYDAKWRLLAGMGPAEPRVVEQPAPPTREMPESSDDVAAVA